MRYILLSSALDDQASTRSFKEFQSRDDLAKAVTEHFEEYLRTEAIANNPGAALKDLQYESDALFDFIDKFFGELVCLELQEEGTDLWIPYASSWVKEAIYLYLRTVMERQNDIAMETDEPMNIP